MGRLDNKVALITGGASGIGLAIVEVFAREGARIILSDINDERGLAAVETLDQQLSGLNGEVEYRHLDVASESDWKEVYQYISSQIGHLDVLVNNAGITGLQEYPGFHDPENIELSNWQSVHDTNLNGVVLGCKYGIKLMKTSSSASIINISSRSGMVGIPAAAAYASSKAAVRNHSKSVALYCAQQSYPIRCNSIHPGAILTPMWDAMLGEGKSREAGIKQVASEIPLGHMGEPEDVANAAIFLASEESKYITGIELTVDGGILAGSAAAPGKQ